LGLKDNLPGLMLENVIDVIKIKSERSTDVSFIERGGI
jgi:hypothetical protein